MTHGRIHIGERGSVSETDKASEEGKAVLDELLISCRDRRPIIEEL